MNRREFLAVPALAFGAVQRGIAVNEIRPGIFVVEHAYPWPSNSAVLKMRSGDVILLDTPYTPEATIELLEWVRSRFRRLPKLAINTHYHVDRLGGNQALLAAGIPVHGSDHTVQLLEQKGRSTHAELAAMIQDPSIREHYLTLKLAPPDQVFPEQKGLKLRFGKDHVEVFWPGAAHTPDNVVVWWPERRCLYSACAVVASPKLGNMREADVASWLQALDRMEALKPEIVIPGHGGAEQQYSAALIAHTRQLLTQLGKQPQGPSLRPSPAR